MRVLGTKLRSSGMGASALTCRDISLALNYIFGSWLVESLNIKPVDIEPMHACVETTVGACTYMHTDTDIHMHMCMVHIWTDSEKGLV